VGGAGNSGVAVAEPTVSSNWVMIRAACCRAVCCAWKVCMSCRACCAYWTGSVICCSWALAAFASNCTGGVAAICFCVSFSVCEWISC
jgi:hypothetical protein